MSTTNFILRKVSDFKCACIIKIVAKEKGAGQQLGSQADSAGLIYLYTAHWKFMCPHHMYVNLSHLTLFHYSYTAQKYHLMAFNTQCSRTGSIIT